MVNADDCREQGQVPSKSSTMPRHSAGGTSSTRPLSRGRSGWASWWASGQALFARSGEIATSLSAKADGGFGLPGPGSDLPQWLARQQRVCALRSDDTAVRHRRASDTDPVRETIDDNETGRLAGFFDAEGFASRAQEVQGDRKAHRTAGGRAAAMIQERSALSATLPRPVDLFERVASGRRSTGLLLDGIASNRISYVCPDVVVGGETGADMEPPDERCTRPTSG
jgi:hypothetical protein